MDQSVNCKNAKIKMHILSAPDHFPLRIVTAAFDLKKKVLVGA